MIETLKLSDKKVVELIKSGSVLALPTDTVYGICASAANEAAVADLYALKSRESKPGTVIAGSIDQLVELGIKRRYLTAVSQFWPGPVSIEIPHSISYLSQGTGRQAFRVVSDKALIDLLVQTGPLLTSSCNIPGDPPANNIEEAISYFGDELAAYVDGGDLSSRQPSTLIRMVDDSIEIIRQGSVKIDEAGRILKS